MLGRSEQVRELRVPAKVRRLGSSRVNTERARGGNTNGGGLFL